MSGNEIINSAGGALSKQNDATGAIRNNNSPTGQDAASQASDQANANQARVLKSIGQDSAASEMIGQIQDPKLRITLFLEIFGSKGAQTPPASMFKDGSGGIDDPLALFFMMIFYLKKAAPNFKWEDVLKTATAAGNQTFNSISVDTAFLPQRQVPQNQPAAITGANFKGAVQASYDASGKSISTPKGEAAKKLQKQVDADTAIMKAQMGSNPSAGGDTSSPVIIWPIQGMPTIAGGLNKTVDWPSKSVATFAEPTLSINNGASPIEIDLEFTYAVGVFGVGDGEITAATGGLDPDTGQPSTSGEPSTNADGKWWTVEEVMGMIYLATSLVYPFESSPVVADQSKPQEQQTDTRTSAQFPVVFLRHYSLFPFLTPFVVKGVKIEPDEEQPLIITEKNKLNMVRTHLTFPAVRQVVKITLSLISAHYYLPVFGGKDTEGDIKKQTSGETYLALANTLLFDRLKR